jgi:S1-C subfamily serine protease
MQRPVSLLCDALFWRDGVGNGFVKHAITMLAVSLGAALAIFSFAGSRTTAQTTIAAAGAPPPVVYKRIVSPTVALVEYVNEQKHGTAFCVTFKDGTAYLLTNQHVIANEQTGQLEPFVVVFPDHPTQRLPARVVKSGLYRAGARSGTALVPDLAVIAVDNVPFPVATLAVNTVAPDAKVPISIVGFPNRQTDTWVARKRAYLAAATADGTVSDNGGPFDDADVYITYNATTFEGESGGPLYDPGSGSFFGVVRAVDGEVGSGEEGLAIPAATVRRFVADLKDVSIVAYTPPPGSPASNALHGGPRPQRRVAGTPSCLLALALFSRDYAEWHQFRSALIDAHVRMVSESEQRRLRSFESALRGGSRRIAATSNARTARLTNALVADIKRFDAVTPPSPVSRLMLTRSMSRLHSVTTCRPGS